MAEIKDLKIFNAALVLNGANIDACVQVSEEVIKKDHPFAYMTTVIKFLYNVVVEFKCLL